MGERIAWLSVILNLALGALKVAAGHFGGSHAVVADGVHSFSDVISGVVLGVAMRIAGKPKDADHPYGHGRVQSVAAKLIGLSVLFAGVKVGYDALGRIAAVPSGVPSSLALGASLLSLGVKEAMFRYKLALGRRIGSSAVVASAWHHRSDAWSSAVAVLGVAGALAGIHFADCAAGLGVAALIVAMGVRITWQAVDELMDRSEPALVQAVIQSALRVSGVVRVSEVRTRSAGLSCLVDAEVEVCKKLTLEQAHNIAECVRETVCKEVPRVGEVFVHLDPASSENCADCECMGKTWRTSASASHFISLPEKTSEE